MAGASTESRRDKLLTKGAKGDQAAGGVSAVASAVSRFHAMGARCSSTNVRVSTQLRLAPQQVRAQRRQQQADRHVKLVDAASTSTFASRSIGLPSGPRCSTMDGAR